jgi:hypothetical protein
VLTWRQVLDCDAEREGEGRTAVVMNLGRDAILAFLFDVNGLVVLTPFIGHLG